MAESFTHEEVHELERALTAGDRPSCPRCSSLLDRREIAPRPDVSYVRDRVWLACPTCHRSVVLDRVDRSARP